MSNDKAGTNIVRSETKKLKRELTLLPLFGLIYFTVCGGSFGAEPMVSLSGPGFALLLLILTPLVFSIPNMLMVREMQSMMPAEGGYYHWLKKAFGPFVGFMGGWMNWVVSWVDVSIYPVLAATYLAFFIPALNNGATIGGIFLSGTCAFVPGSDGPDLVDKLSQCPRCTSNRFDHGLAGCGHDDPTTGIVGYRHCGLDQERYNHPSSIPAVTVRQ